MDEIKVAIYARTSSEGQKEAKTIEGQLNELSPYAESQGWIVYDVYKDDGISGAFLEGRPDFARLLSDMEQKQFDTLLVSEHSRITRTEDLQERGRILQLLKDNRIKLASPHEGILDLSQFSGELMTTLNFLFASEEKRQIYRRMRRGKLKKLADNQYCLPNWPFGLKKVTERDDKGKVLDHKFILHPDEYPTLRTVYEKVVNEGMSLNDVVVYLNEMGSTTRRGRKWRQPNLSAILSKEESLTGTIISNKYILKQVGPGKFRRIYNPDKSLVMRPENEWIRVSVPKIYEKWEYERLKKQIMENRNHTYDRTKQEDPFILRGKLKCGICGQNYSCRSQKSTIKKGIVTYHHYICMNRRLMEKHLNPEIKKCNKSPVINIHVIHHQIEQQLFQRLFTMPKETLKSWGSIKSKKNILQNLEQKLSKINSDIEKQKMAESRLLDDAISDLSFSPDAIKQKKEKIEKTLNVLLEEKGKIKEELSKVKQSQANYLNLEKASKEIGKLSKRLIKKVADMPVSEKKKFIQYFIPPGEQITIYPFYPDNEDGDRSIKIPELDRKTQITWNWNFNGKFDIQKVLRALKHYDQYGTIPDIFDHKSMISK